MGGSDGCRNDILLIAWEYVTWLLLRTSIRRDISSPSTSGNKPRIAYIWMYVSWDRYRDTYPDIWVRRVIIIIGSVMVIAMFIVSCYSSRHDSGCIVTSYLFMVIPVMIPVIWFRSSSVWFMSFCLCILVMIIVWFATLILYAWDCCGMRQGYIYEGFLVWIIPSTYQSHRTVT